MEYTLTTAAAADAITENLWLWRATEIEAYKADPRQYIIDYCACARCVNLKKAQQHAAEVQAQVDAWLEENAERIAERAEAEA